MGRNRFAWLLVLVGAAAVYLFENNAGTRVLLLSVLILPVLSGLLLLLRKRPEAALTAPETAERGAPAEVAVRLSAGTAALEIRNLLTGERKTLDLPESGAVGLELRHCGTHVIAVRHITEYDFLGLFVRRTPCAAEAACTVSPQTFPVSVELAERDAPDDAQTYSTRSPGYDPSETFRIREYVPGDPVRQIHWKLSEKSGKTLVRDFGKPLPHQALLAFERGGAAAPDGDALDDALDLLVSLRAALRDMEIDTTAYPPPEAILRGAEEGWFSEHLTADFEHVAVICPAAAADPEPFGRNAVLLTPGTTFSAAELRTGDFKLIF